MLISDHFLEKLPFPYLLISEAGKVVKRSEKAESELFCKDTFLDLIEPAFISIAENAYLTNNQAELELPVLTKDKQYLLHRVYSLKDVKNGHIHIFILPLLDRIADIRAVIEQIESKFSFFQNELKQNKQYINQTVFEIQEAALANQHYQNIEKLAAGIAHEIRNPLTTVGGFIQLLKPYLIDIGKEQYVDIVLDELNRANHIIFEFLNASKPQEDKKIPISINKLVKDISLLYESEAILKAISIHNQFSNTDVEIIANHKQLKQVLVNLIKNAFEALEGRNNNTALGVILLRTVVEHDHAAIIVEDNGCGMSEDTIKNLFLPFHTTKASGTGVGLSVCKNIIEEHQGYIEVESVLGKGTKFTIIFPYNKNSEVNKMNVSINRQ